MKPLVLNAWTQASGQESRVCLESTCGPTHIEVAKPRRLADGDYTVGISLSGVGLAMAPDEILVADGLIRKIQVRAGSPVTLDVVLEHSAEPVLTVVPGMPVRVEFAFARSPLAALFSGKTIAVDPGHGGRDAGVRGPVNLLEKDVALDIATLLQKMLSECGATPLMSRDCDCDVDPRGWAIALSMAQPELLVEIHASGEKNPMSRSYHAYARRGSDESLLAAREIAGALTERMGTTFSGIEPTDFAAIPLWPAVRLEPVCLTHFVDEANFRAPLFRKRIAQAIFNGISRYLSSASQGGMARAG
ncbi:MAG: N-acetylmuramoyl-L-alanine amidase [Bacillota bacterium]